VVSKIKSESLSNVLTAADWQRNPLGQIFKPHSKLFSIFFNLLSHIRLHGPLNTRNTPKNFRVVLRVSRAIFQCVEAELNIIRKTQNSANFCLVFPPTFWHIGGQT
jgi:hypothetical protein